MISYAQHDEDTFLWEFFPDKTDGHFIDVGASDPVVGSVSKSFYDAGWRGINVEPLPFCYEALQLHQPESFNVRAALGDEAGYKDLYYNTGLLGLSTFVQTYAMKFKLNEVLRTPVWTLKQLCETGVQWPIDWLKIDVEGWETEVIAGGDWTKYRPKLICVEATEPNTSIPSHERWEPLLLQVGYDFLEFDGLNRFYRDRENA